MHSKIHVSRKAKTTNNLEQREVGNNAEQHTNFFLKKRSCFHHLYTASYLDLNKGNGSLYTHASISSE